VFNIQQHNIGKIKSLRHQLKQVEVYLSEIPRLTFAKQFSPAHKKKKKTQLTTNLATFQSDFDVEPA
jgi:hypothetical protein